MRKKIAIVGLTVFAAVTIHWTFFQVREHVPGVYDRPLGACIVEAYQARGIVVLVCPHMDMIKLWPLPVENPWFEDPVEPNSPWITYAHWAE